MAQADVGLGKPVYGGEQDIKTALQLEVAGEENGESGSQAPQGRAMHGSENEAVPIKTPSLNFSIGCPGEHKNRRQQRAAKSKG